MRAAAECGDMLSELGTAMAERREPPRPDAARVHVLDDDLKSHRFMRVTCVESSYIRAKACTNNNA